MSSNQQSTFRGGSGREEGRSGENMVPQTGADRSDMHTSGVQFEEEQRALREQLEVALVLLQRVHINMEESAERRHQRYEQPQSLLQLNQYLEQFQRDKQDLQEQLETHERLIRTLRDQLSQSAERWERRLQCRYGQLHALRSYGMNFEQEVEEDDDDPQGVLDEFEEQGLN